MLMSCEDKLVLMVDQLNNNQVMLRDNMYTSIDDEIASLQCHFKCLNVDATIVTVMDALKMDFIPDDCFDLIIDKGYQNSIIAQILLSYSFIFLSSRSVRLSALHSKEYF